MCVLFKALFPSAVVSRNHQCGSGGLAVTKAQVDGVCPNIVVTVVGLLPLLLCL